MTSAIYDINTLSACTAPQSDSTSFQSLDSETVQYFSDKGLKINTLEVAISIVQYYISPVQHPLAKGHMWQCPLRHDHQQARSAPGGALPRAIPNQSWQQV